MAVPWFGGPDAGLWDRIQIGPANFLSSIEIDGELSFKLDVQPAPGTDGARETYQGYEPARINVTVKLTTQNELDEYVDLVKIIRPKPGKTKPTPVDIIHPALEIYGLRKFYIPKLPLLRPGGPQLFLARFGCVEFFDKPKASGTQAAPQIVNLATIFDGNNKATPGSPSKDNVGP